MHTTTFSFSSTRQPTTALKYSGCLDSATSSPRLCVRIWCRFGATKLVFYLTMSLRVSSNVGMRKGAAGTCAHMRTL
jgi:hypothetical protein